MEVLLLLIYYYYIYIFRKFDNVRKQLMESELKRILAEEKLSPDSFEVASRCLK